MTIAELHGKISHTGTNLHDQLEDLLTSDVFSASKYVRPAALLIPFLRTSVDLNGVSAAEHLSEKVHGVEYRFWPMMEHCEPDVLIDLHIEGGKHTLVMVEAKYYSTKSGGPMELEELEVAQAPSDQLAIEYLDLLHAHRHFGLNSEDIQYRCLIYLTAHRILPKQALQESLAEISHFAPSGDVYLFWTSWFKIQPLLTDSTGWLPWEGPILQDLSMLMERKGLIAFQGFRPLASLNQIRETPIYVRARKNYFEQIQRVPSLLALYQKGTL